MLLFEDAPDKPAEPKHELSIVAAYLDEEHKAMLNEMLAAGRGKLNKSEVIRQCIRLGHRTMLKKRGAA